jgi:hypothetical protein
MASTFVFFHVGENSEQPQMLVNSIRLTNKEAIIIFCSDELTPDINGVSKRVNIKGDLKNLMSYRLKAFEEVKLDHPALYLDTDMLVLKKITPEQIIGDKKVIMCKRSFNLDGAFIGNFRGLDFMEYDKKPLGLVYPYVACATITKNWEIWQELSEILLNLDEKFKIWYGDQEALKKIQTTLTPEEFGVINEFEFGCLPDENAYVPRAAILHFKGAQRKPVMKVFHNKMINFFVKQNKNDDSN